MEVDTLKSKLKTSWCPFTWKIPNSSDSNDTEAVELPIIYFMFLLEMCYKCVETNDTESAMENLLKAKETLRTIREENSYVDTIRAFEHVYFASKGYVMLEMKNLEDPKSITDTISRMHEISDFNSKELGALYGCKSIVLLALYHIKVEDCIAAATEAVTRDPENAFWHFTLAKALRCKRRFYSPSETPSDLEQKHFTIAYKNIKHPYIAAFYVQMLYESCLNNYKETSNLKQQQITILKEILESGTQHYKSLLKVAICCIRIQQYEMASHCLDRVEEIIADSPTTVHYRGLISQSQHNFEEALDYFKEAGSRGNFGADISYVKLLIKHKRCSPLEYLTDMLKRYSKDEKYKQKVLLYIATTYYVIHLDIKKAAENYLEAIKCNPASLILKKRNNILNKYYKFGIYYFIKNELCGKMQKLHLESHLMVTLLEVCKRHFQQQQTA